MATTPSLLVVVAVEAGFMPPRLLAVPAAAALPAGVRLVAVPFAGRSVGASAASVASAPALALAAWGRHRTSILGVPAPRGAPRWVAAYAASSEPAGDTHGDDDDNNKTHEDRYFLEHMEMEADNAMALLALMEPPASLMAKAEEVKAQLQAAKNALEAREEKKPACVMGLLGAIYAVVDLGEQLFDPVAYKRVRLEIQSDTRAVLLIGNSPGRTFAFSSPDDTGAMSRAVGVAVQSAAAATGRCVGPENIHKVLPFVDPEDW